MGYNLENLMESVMRIFGRKRKLFEWPGLVCYSLEGATQVCKRLEVSCVRLMGITYKTLNFVSVEDTVLVVV